MVQGTSTTYGCDDGNTISGDGCSSACKIESKFECTDDNDLTTRDTCIEICGDGFNMGYYSCDDGNTATGDGCDSNCEIELGYLCSGGSSSTKDVCTEKCGDKMIFGYVSSAFNNPCDDGNSANGDGCDSNCKIETGWTCDTATGGANGELYTTCDEECDGIWRGDSNLACDNGNTDPFSTLGFDGCDTSCNVDPGWTCSNTAG